jgi:hypothetical protein
MHRSGNFVEIVSDAVVNSILKEVESPAVNMNVVRLEKHPDCRLYSKGDYLRTRRMPSSWFWIMREIPYTIIYDEEVLSGRACAI